jgi:uncharacterized protein with FMN-binding domain
MGRNKKVEIEAKIKIEVKIEVKRISSLNILKKPSNSSDQ